MLKKILGIGSIFILVKIFSFGFIQLLPQIVSNKLYSQISLLSTYEFILLYIFLGGYDRVLFRFFKDEKDKSTFWNNFFYYWKYILIVVFVANLFLLKHFFDFKILAILIISTTLIFSVIRELFVYYNRLQGNISKVFQFLGVIAIIKFILIFICIYYFPSINTYIYVNFSVFLVLLIIPFLKKRHYIKLNYKPNIAEKQKAKKYLSFALPIALNVVVFSLFNYADRFMIEEMIGIEKVGIYAFGYGFGTMGFIVISFFQGYLEPFMMNLKNKKTQRNVFNQYNSFLILCIILFSIISYFLVSYSIKTYYDDIYLESLPIFNIVLISYLLVPIYSINKIKMEVLKKTKLITISYSIATLVNIILNWYLIPIYQINGAVIATLISSITLVIVTLCYIPIQKSITIGIEIGNVITITSLAYFMFIQNILFSILCVSVLFLLNLSQALKFIKNYILKKNDTKNI